MLNGGKTRSTLLLILKALLGLGLLGFVLYKAGTRNVYESLANVNLFNLTVAVLFVLASYGLGIKRWQVLSRSVGVETGYQRLTVLHFLGLFCNYFLPAGVGGDMVKAYYLSKSELRRNAYLSVLLDRYVGLLALLAVASAITFLQPKDDFHLKLSYIIWFLFVAFIGGGLAVLFFTDMVARLLERRDWQRMVDRLRDLTSLTRGFFGNYRAVTMALLLSIGAQACAILAVEQLSLGVGAKADLSSFFVIVPLVFLVSVLPISPGGLGTREYALVYMLSRAYILSGMESAQAQSTAATVALLWLAVNLLTSLPGAASYPLLGRMRIAEQEATIKESVY
jgi:glycosyltransferase 2 family protein